MNTDRPQGELAFSLWWVLAGTVGLALGFVAAGTVAFPVFSTHCGRSPGLAVAAIGNTGSESSTSRRLTTRAGWDPVRPPFPFALFFC